MNTPVTASHDIAVGIERRERRVEGPAGIDAAGERSQTASRTPPSMNRYQLRRLSRGKARSRAPIISGTMKLPSVLGIEGIRKNHTMMMPCMVNRRLYMSELTRSACGVASSMRIAVAAAPPMKKKKSQAGEIENRNSLVVGREEP